MAQTILFVDDSASVRNVMGIALRAAGYEVIEAVDGVDALAKLDGTKLNLIISDVNMPNMNGIEFLKNVKGNADYQGIPVMMLTTEAGQDMIAQGRAAGAKAWMVKPFKPRQMLDAVSKLVLP